MIIPCCQIPKVLGRWYGEGSLYAHCWNKPFEVGIRLSSCLIMIIGPCLWLYWEEFSLSQLQGIKILPFLDFYCSICGHLWVEAMVSQSLLLVWQYFTATDGLCVHLFCALYMAMQLRPNSVQKWRQYIIISPQKRLELWFYFKN